MKLRSLLLIAAFVLGVVVPTACGQTAQSTSYSSSTLAPGSLGTAAETTTSLSGPGTLRFRVTDSAGYAVEGVQVYVADSAGHMLAQTSAATGYLVVGLETGSYDVRVDARGSKYMSQSRVVAVEPGENEADFTLLVGRTIRGRVTWSGRPYIWMGAHPYPADDGEVRQLQVSAGSGDFAIEGLTPGRYTVSADVFWYGGDSSETATVIDVTAADVEGVDFDIGALEPLPATTIYTGTTTSHS